LGYVFHPPLAPTAYTYKATTGFIPLEERWVAHIPGFPVKFGGVDALYAAFLNESRTRSRLLDAHTGDPGISVVFQEMWDTTKLNHKLSRPRGSLKARPAHPSVRGGERARCGL